METNKIFDLTKRSIRNIRLVSLVVGLVLTYLIINPIKSDFIIYVNKLDIKLIFIILVVFLFYSRSYGTIIDLRVMQRNFVNSHIDDKFPKKGWLPLIVFSAIFISMTLLIKDIKLFGGLLILFWLYNLIFWRFFSKEMSKFLRNNYKDFNKTESFIDKEKMKICWRYFVEFKWNRDRHIWVFSFLLLGFIMIMTDLSIKLESIFQINNNNIIASSLLLIGVVFGELYIWVKRTKLRYQIRCVEDVAEKYKIESK